MPDTLAPVAEGFLELAALAHERFGLDLRPGKEGLASSRLWKTMQQRGLADFNEYCDYVKSDRSGEALVAMIDALTTNHTSFFRERRHFDFLRETVVPAWRSRSAVNLWSAACSSGEEPYTLALTLTEAGLGPACQIFATDISTRVLATAESAMYRDTSFPQPLEPWLKKYLLRGKDAATGWYRIKPEVQRMVRFDRLNLIDDFPSLPKFAAIFCRNVMIYFDRPTQERLVNKLAAQLEPGGYLFVGHAESLNALRHTLEYIAPATYRRSTREGDEQGGRVA